MATQYDAVVIGAGSNGLVAASYLAKAGQRVLVVDQRDGVGTRSEFAAGFTREIGAGIGWLPDKIVGDLGLGRHGLKVQSANPTVVTPLPDGGSLTLWTDIAKTAAEIGRFSKKDAQKWPEFCRFVAKVTKVFEDVYQTVPPDGLELTAGDLMALGPIGLKVRQFGDRDMFEFIRVLPQSAQEFFEDWFETDALRATLAGDAIKNIRQGVRSAGTTFVFLHHQVGNAEGTFRASRVVTGGLGRVLADAAKGHGAEIRTGVRVECVITEDGIAKGVMLSDGVGNNALEIRAKKVVSSLDTTATMMLIDPMELPPSYVRAVKNIKYRGATGIINLALGELPKFAGVGADALKGKVHIGPTLEYLERAYDASKYGQISERPMMEITLPSLNDASLAPAGQHVQQMQHVMTIHAQFAPYHLRDGAEWDAAACDTLLNNVLNALDQYAPNVRGAIVGSEVISPKDLETEFGLTHGSLNQGELTLDQLFFMRPVPGYARYTTPVERLYMCGAATHPGGGLTGVSAFNAAKVIAKDK